MKCNFRLQYTTIFDGFYQMEFWLKVSLVSQLPVCIPHVTAQPFWFPLSFLVTRLLYYSIYFFVNHVWIHNETLDVLPWFMEASICDQATQCWVNKRCPTFSCVLNYETIRKSQNWHTFLNFKSYSNEANKSTMLKFIQDLFNKIDIIYKSSQKKIWKI
jgi:hypothetical protein